MYLRNLTEFKLRSNNNNNNNNNNESNNNNYNNTSVCQLFIPLILADWLID